MKISKDRSNGEVYLETSINFHNYDCVMIIILISVM